MLNYFKNGMFSHCFTVQMRRATQLQVVSQRFLLAVCLLMSASEDTAEKEAGTQGVGGASHHRKCCKREGP